MNTSVVLEELSAHLLVCDCICVYVTCVCVCVLVAVCAHLPQGCSFTAISYPHKVTVYLPRPSFVPHRLADGHIDYQHRVQQVALYMCVCECGERWAVTGSIDVNTTTDWKQSLVSLGVSAARGTSGGVFKAKQNVPAKQTSHPRTEV